MVGNEPALKLLTRIIVRVARSSATTAHTSLQPAGLLDYLKSSDEARCGHSDNAVISQLM